MTAIRSSIQANTQPCLSANGFPQPKFQLLNDALKEGCATAIELAVNATVSIFDSKITQLKDIKNDCKETKKTRSKQLLQSIQKFKLQAENCVDEIISDEINYQNNNIFGIVAKRIAQILKYWFGCKTSTDKANLIKEKISNSLYQREKEITKYLIDSEPIDEQTEDIHKIRQKLTQKNNDLQIEIEQLNEEKKLIEEEIKDLPKKILESNSRLNKEIRELNYEKYKLVNELKKLKDEKNEIKSVLFSIKLSLSSSKKTNLNNETQKKTKESELKIIKNDAEKIKSNIINFRNNIAYKSRELDENDTLISKSEKSLDEINKKIKDTENEKAIIENTLKNSAYTKTSETSKETNIKKEFTQYNSSLYVSFNKPYLSPSIFSNLDQEIRNDSRIENYKKHEFVPKTVKETMELLNISNDAVKKLYLDFPSVNGLVLSDNPDCKLNEHYNSMTILGLQKAKELYSEEVEIETEEQMLTEIKSIKKAAKALNSEREKLLNSQRVDDKKISPATRQMMKKAMEDFTDRKFELEMRLHVLLTLTESEEIKKEIRSSIILMRAQHNAEKSSMEKTMKLKLELEARLDLIAKNGS